MEMLVYTMSQEPVQFVISNTFHGFSYTGTTRISSPNLLTIPSNLQVRELAYSYRNMGLLVQSLSDEPISIVLIGHINSPRSTYLALPCIDYPTQDQYTYYGISAESDQSSRYGQILLVGCKDNTVITITPTQDVQLPQNPQQSNSPTVNVAAGSSHTVTLHSLQTLLIATRYVDLSGTKIVSNKPLTVVGGHDCAMVPNHYIDCDPMSTQVIPTFIWGTHYLLTPLETRVLGQRYKLITSLDDTEIIISCPQNLTRHVLSSSGSVHIIDTNFSAFCDVVCSDPCYIAGLSYGRDYPISGPNGDPLLMTIPPIRQYPHNVTFTTLPEMPTNHYSVAIPIDSYFNGTILINGVLTVTSGWSPIYLENGEISGYGYNSSANGNYTISHSHPEGRIYVSVYGFFHYGGYGYVAGMLLNDLTIGENKMLYIIDRNCSFRR